MLQLRKHESSIAQYALPTGHPGVNHPDGLSWVLPGELAVGGMPRAGDSVWLAQSGIQTILSLNAKSEGVLPSDVLTQFQCIQYVLPDSTYELPLQVRDLQEVVSLLYRQISRKRAVYVHCLVGVERSPTVCVAYLCRYYRMPLCDAVQALKRVYSPSVPSNHQLRIIRQFLGEPEVSL